MDDFKVENAKDLIEAMSNLEDLRLFVTDIEREIMDIVDKKIKEIPEDKRDEDCNQIDSLMEMRSIAIHKIASHEYDGTEEDATTDKTPKNMNL